MKPGALQRTPGALWVRCGGLTHPESRREQQHPPRVRCCVYPYRATHPFSTHGGAPRLHAQLWGRVYCADVGRFM